MPLPADLGARLRAPDFWRRYFFEAGSGEDKEYVEHTAEFPVGDGYALLVGINDVAIHLDLRTPDDTEPVTLGWDDQAHWMPDVLRWTELDLIGRAAAVTDPELRHPGPVLSLAGRFVVLDRADDLDRITPMMDAAFGPAPEPVWWPCTRNWLCKADGATMASPGPSTTGTGRSIRSATAASTATCTRYPPAIVWPATPRSSAGQVQTGPDSAIRGCRRHSVRSRLRR